MSITAVEAQPFLLPGDSPNAALLFIHGFTASPSEVAPTARLINEAGNLTVRGLLLPGHGTNPDHLNNTRWCDWYQAVQEECSALQKDYDRVFLAGLSMGGLLALYAGLRVDGLQGIISINTPIFMRRFLRLRMASLLQVWKIHWPKEAIDPALQEQRRFAYDCYPRKAFSSMLKLRSRVMAELPAMKLPLLIIQSRQDETVLAESAQYISRRCRQADVRLLELPCSTHIATMGAEKETIAREILEFINLVENIRKRKEI